MMVMPVILMMMDGGIMVMMLRIAVVMLLVLIPAEYDRVVHGEEGHDPLQTN